MVKLRKPWRRQLDSYTYTHKIVEVVAHFPMLHAYGVGFEQFRSISEEKRGKILEYAKYILAYELDDEIDAAHFFLRVVGIRKNPKNQNYIKADYLELLYQYWRQQFITPREACRWPKNMPLGVFAMAALLGRGRVRIIEEIKPNYLIAVQTERRNRLEEYLQLTTKFKKPDERRVTWDFKDDREGEQENRLQCADAVENKESE